jgi:hypothetical protein
MKKLLFILVAGAALAVAAPATAATTSLIGGATPDGSAIRLVSDLSNTSTADDFSGINFADLGGLKFEDLDVLSAEYNVTDDGCGGGSPRFQLNIDGKNVFVYFGPAPSFTGCPLNSWQGTGNLIGSTDARFDLGQLSGSQTATYAQALAFLTGKTITGVQLVVDSGWFFADKEQTVLVRNVLLNTTMVGSTLNGMNPARACRAQRQLMGTAAFAAFYGTETSNRRNAFGKCVSTMAKERRSGTLAVAHATIKAATKTCKANGAKGRALGGCVSRQSSGIVTVSANPSRTKARGKGKRRP